MQRLDLIFIPVLFILLSSLAICADDLKEPKLNVSMKIDTTIDEILAMNPELAKNNSQKGKENGMLTIRGPLNFNLIYADKIQLNYPDAKLVIYPIEDKKLMYIHVFPLINNMSEKTMQVFLLNMESELTTHGWTKVQNPQRESQTAGWGIHEHATFRLNAGSAKQSQIEIILTTFTDASVRCAMDAQDKALPGCLNQFVRVGIYNVPG
jgi:hypothetical protein